MLGVVRSALARQPFGRFVLKEDQGIYHWYLKQLAETFAPQACELRMARTDSAPFWARLEAAAIRDDQGGAVYRAMLSDITDRKQAEQEITRLASFPLLNPQPVVEVTDRNFDSPKRP